MHPSSRKIGAALTAAALGIGALTIAPAAAIAAPDTENYLYSIAAEDAVHLDDLDIVDDTKDNVVVLGGADTEKVLAERGITPVAVENYAESISGTPAPRAAAAIADENAPAPAANYPLPTRLSANRYDTYFGGYRTTAAYEKFGKDIAQAYPELAQQIDFGDSWQKIQDPATGHDLLALRLTADVAKQPQPTDGQEGRPRFVLVAQAHAREIIAGELAWRYATQLLDGYGKDPKTTSLLNTTEVWIVFQANPDSSVVVQGELAKPDLRLTVNGDANPVTASKAWQRKNANNSIFTTPTSSNWGSQQSGVDLNRNFPTAWGGTNSSPDSRSLSYRGTGPGSEPETIATTKLLTELFGQHEVGTDDAKAAPENRQGTYVNLHSYSNYVIYPYAYDYKVNVPNLEALRKSAFRQSYVNGFQTGKAGEILYDNAGNDIDWVYDQLGVPAFTYEIGTAANGGFFPKYERTQEFFDKTEPGISFAAQAAYAPYTAPIGAVVDTATAQRDDHSVVTVSGSANDTHYGTFTAPGHVPPAATNIVAVEAAVASSFDQITTTTEQQIAEPAPTVDYKIAIPAEAKSSQNTSVFVRAKNGSGKWGPWNTAFVQAAPLASFKLSLDINAPKQGGTVTVTAIAQDVTGAELGDYSDRVTLKSDVATDVIAGNTVTFPTASPHNITATLDDVSTTLLVQVSPAVPVGTEAGTDGAGTQAEGSTATEGTTDGAGTQAGGSTDGTGSTDPGNGSSATAGNGTTGSSTGAETPDEGLAGTGVNPALPIGIGALLIAAGGFLFFRRQRALASVEN